MYFYLTCGRENGIPIIAENVGPYISLDEALSKWPGYRVATEQEYDEYLEYWNKH
jgi:hypothetical protein